jgi:hypothetical protein
VGKMLTLKSAHNLLEFVINLNLQTLGIYLFEKWVSPFCSKLAPQGIKASHADDPCRSGAKPKLKISVVDRDRMHGTQLNQAKKLARVISLGCDSRQS